MAADRIKSKVYIYAAIIHPVDPAEKEDLIVNPGYLLAPDETSARILVSRMIPETLIDRLAEVEVIVRPF